MNFLKKMFAAKDPVDQLKIHHARQDWAGVLAAAKRLDHETLEPDARAAVEQLTSEAGDSLALLNLEEGEWALQSGDKLKARDHFQLAREQARSTEMRERVSRALETPQERSATTSPDLAGGAECSTGCGPACAPPAPREALSPAGELNDEERFELLLATLPPEVASRYRQAGPQFSEAWLAVQDGDDDRAAALLDRIPEVERDALYFAERGALLARRKDFPAAIGDLRRALAEDPELFPAFESLVAAHAAGGSPTALRDVLKQALAEQRFVGFCWARLAELHAAEREWEAALAAGLAALDAGQQDAELLVLCSQLLEREGQNERAEQLLRRLPAGGCGGGAHPMLAEFWLRRETHLDRALESFKGALRQEKDNPRWLLRIAQVYLAKGWRKDAAVQLERLAGAADLPPALQAELETAAKELENG